MNKTVEVLYDEYIESYDPRAMLPKLKKNELIKEAGYESLEAKIDFVEPEILKRMVGENNA